MAEYGKHDEAEERATAREIIGMARPIEELDMPGYKSVIEFDSMIADKEDYQLGYCSYGGLDLDDMFGAFVDENYGVIGGGVTVDDFTPEGLEDRVGGKEMSGEPGARKGIGGATGDKVRSKSSAPEFVRGHSTRAVHSGSGDEREMGHKYP